MGEVVEGISASTGSSSKIEAARWKESVESDFRNAMRNIAASVSVVTFGAGREASGFTATSVVSLSMETPTLLVSINRSSASWPLLKKHGRFTVNILSAAHLSIAETFAGRRGLKGNERYIDPRWQHGIGQIPCLPDALAAVECDLEEAIERYSHAILIGRVLNVLSGSARPPLVYWQGGYRHFCD